MSRAIKTIKPLRSFETRPNEQNAPRALFGNSSSKSKSNAPVLTVYPTEVEKAVHGNAQGSAYHIFYSPPGLLKFWPFPPDLSLHLHDGKSGDGSATEGETPKLLDIVIEMTLLERFMCCVGSVKHLRAPETIGSLTKPGPPSPTDQNLQLHSGLGHGIWMDPVLTKLLSRDQAKPLEWCANYDEWNGFDASFIVPMYLAANRDGDVL
jgi:hypothetical protein